MLRSRFQSIPGAFNDCLVPHDKSDDTKKRGFKATFSRKFDQVLITAVMFSYFHSHFYLSELCLRLCSLFWYPATI